AFWFERADPPPERQRTVCDGRRKRHPDFFGYSSNSSPLPKFTPAKERGGVMKDAKCAGNSLTPCLVFVRLMERNSESIFRSKAATATGAQASSLAMSAIGRTF